MKKKLILASFIILSSCQGPRPKNLGLNDQSLLAPCPESPNCINSHYNEDELHFAGPLKYEIPKTEAIKRMTRILNSTDGVKIITATPQYIHAEFTSQILGFIDDLEINLSHEGLIHFKSASRVGHSDLGANRKRIENLAFRFYQNE